MNKTELTSAVAAKAGLTKVDAGKAVAAMIDTVKEEMAKGNKITLVGFGTFSVQNRPARKGRNPRTGKDITIAAKKIAKFKPGKGIL